MLTVKKTAVVLVAAALCLSLTSCGELRSLKYKLHGMDAAPKIFEVGGNALEEYEKNKAPEPEKDEYEFRTLVSDDGAEYAELTAYNGGEVNVTVPTLSDGTAVKSVGADSFGENDSLYSIGIPYGVEKVGDYAFYGCANLEDAVLPSSLTSLGSRAFAFCSALEKIYIPKAVTYLGESAFAGCTALKEIGISGGLKVIPYDAFKDCSAVGYIYIPRSVERIEKGAFKGCTSLKRVDISENVTYIADDAFEGCPAVFSCPKDSYAEKYAAEHGLNVNALSTAQEQEVVSTAEDIADRSERELAVEESLLPSLSFGTDDSSDEENTSEPDADTADDSEDNG